MQDRYINSERYNLAVSDLETIARTFDPAAPDDLRTRIIEVLGDLGVWPESVAPVSYEPRPQQTPVDWAALGRLAINRFPKIHTALAR
ncbi:hypothetical protein JUM41_19935 [Rhizobium pusense]|uniref:hypothetical protein n=1 Tax=Agrobacterium pusense TaxID=648995 RepID=UPI001FCDFF3E|nr:hypothetical protein [Agrobacterium pusense]MCJ2876523.1 hypothetical protein [Agrobacterium pusense]